MVSARADDSIMTTPGVVGFVPCYLPCTGPRWRETKAWAKDNTNTCPQEIRAAWISPWNPSWTGIGLSQNTLGAWRMWEPHRSSPVLALISHRNYHSQIILPSRQKWMGRIKHIEFLHSHLGFLGKMADLLTYPIHRSLEIFSVHFVLKFHLCFLWVELTICQNWFKLLVVFWCLRLSEPTITKLTGTLLGALGDVTRASWRLKSLETRLFVQLLAAQTSLGQQQTHEKVPHWWPLVRGILVIQKACPWRDVTMGFALSFDPTCRRRAPRRRLTQHPVIFLLHDSVIKWKHFPRYWPFVRGIHRSRVDSFTYAIDARLQCFLWSAP